MRSPLSHAIARMASTVFRRRRHAAPIEAGARALTIPSLIDADNVSERGAD
jgi:hypothetical protein